MKCGQYHWTCHVYASLNPETHLIPSYYCKNPRQAPRPTKRLSLWKHSLKSDTRLHCLFSHGYLLRRALPSSPDIWTNSRVGTFLAGISSVISSKWVRREWNASRHSLSRPMVYRQKGRMKWQHDSLNITSISSRLRPFVSGMQK